MSDFTLTVRFDEGQLGCIITHIDRLATVMNRVAEALEQPVSDGQIVQAIWPEMVEQNMSFLHDVVTGLRVVLGVLPPDDPYLTPKSGASATRVGAEANRAAWVSKAMGTLDDTQDDEPSWHPSGYTERLSHTSEC